MGNRLLVARDEISGRVARYDYDEVDNLISAEYERGGEVERLYRVSDRMGNLFETRERDDRRYDAGGRLAEDREHFYHYDCEGNLVFKEFKEMVLHGGIVAPINKERLETELGIRFRAFGTGWRYDWQSDGMLARVVRPDGKEVSFAYDALGRRIRKSFAGTTTQFVWDGNVPLHEWQEVAADAGKADVTTWLFEQNTFIPAAKLAANGESFSIVSDYLGTPLQAFDNNGNKVWEQELDIFGRKRRKGNNKSSFIPFKYQGQYEDVETGLYYNRFRYYDPRIGNYISQDPIRLMGNNPTLYGYVGDLNKRTDIFGLKGGGSYSSVRSSNIGGEVHHTPANSINGLSHGEGPSIWMETTDHRMTSSHGWQGKEGALYRQTQLDLINQGKFADAIQMDIDDIQSSFGSKYDSSINEMLDYSYEKGLISEAERDKMKICTK